MPGTGLMLTCTETFAARQTYACPICGRPTIYIGFNLESRATREAHWRTS